MGSKITDKFGSVRAWVTIMLVVSYCCVVAGASYLALTAKISIDVFDKMMDKLDFAGTINLVIMFYFLRQDRQQTVERSKGVANVDSGKDQGAV